MHNRADSNVWVFLTHSSRPFQFFNKNRVQHQLRQIEQDRACHYIDKQSSGNEYKVMQQKPCSTPSMATYDYRQSE